MSKYDVICIGSATIDHFSIINNSFRKVKLGDKILVYDQDLQVGGGGVNSAVGLRRLGLKTASLLKLGRDHNADKIIEVLKKEKIDLIKTRRSIDTTSYSYIASFAKDKDRIIFTYKGSNDDLDYNEIPKLNSKWIYLATMIGKSWPAAKKIARDAKQNGIKLLFNPSKYLAQKGVVFNSPILKCTEVLILNKSEAQTLLRKKANTGIEELLKALNKLGPRIVIITEGKKGVHAYYQGKFYFVPTYNVKVVEVTGAGDAFASGFLGTYIKTKDVLKSLQIGNANASSVVQYLGAQNKLLSWKEANDFVKQHRAIIKMHTHVK